MSQQALHSVQPLAIAPVSTAERETNELLGVLFVPLAMCMAMLIIAAKWPALVAVIETGLE